MNVKIELAYERTVFDNGLVLLISESHKLPLVSLNAYVRCGLDQNPEDHPGLASLTARMLDEGTEKFSYRQIAEMVEGSGGAASIFSQRELSGINIQLRSEDWRLGLELLDQMVCHPVFPSDRTELEKEKVLNHLRAMEDEPQTVASNAFNRIIYNGSPLAYPVLGVPDNLAVIQAPDLLLFHREKYGPEATILVICGDVTTKEVLAEVEERFSRWHNPDLRRLTLPDFRGSNHLYTNPARWTRNNFIFWLVTWVSPATTQTSRPSRSLMSFSETARGLRAAFPGNCETNRAWLTPPTAT